ncbi:MAG: RluA family pseudouridine synthase [Erysipelotrichaceae bacterium]|nr:RluA family pseudouridine synthase [Erysipelotrichaceae bacterium]
MKNMNRLKIDERYQGYTVKMVLSSVFDLSRRQITKHHVAKEIFVNQQVCRLTQLLNLGDVVEIGIVANKAIDFVPEILYEDAQIVIVNKPSGIPTHASSEHPDDDMGSVLKRYYQDEDFVVRSIGRLDKAVSGIVVYAKNKEIAGQLAKLRESKELKKEYLAIVKGTFVNKRGKLEYELAKKKGVRGQSVIAGGQKCITNYEVLHQGEYFSVVKIQIETGRLHQIRAGMAYYGHPLMGDKLYGGSMHAMKRVALHCCHIEFKHPTTHQQIIIDCDAPADMQKMIHKLQKDQ